ncbi:MAG: histidinol dehydrogenase [Cyclonatronaceae bacterium]
MKTWNFADLDDNALSRLCTRPRMDAAGITGIVQTIIDDVRHRGDEAVLELTEKFDGVRPDPLLWPVRPAQDIPVDAEVRKAFERAYENIYLFHKAQIPQNIEVQTMPGVICRRESRPVESVGLYIPGGTAPLPSTVLMLGVPSAIAGCSYRILATPPDKTGKPPLIVELAAALTGIRHIYLAGGAQAIAAMALGTGTVYKVDKVFGPGNQFVTSAKMLLQNSNALVGMDLPAGPSEVMVVADKTAEAGFIATDLLSQAEHGADSQVVLVTVGPFDTKAVTDAIEKHLSDLPRADMARKALEHSFIVSTDNSEQALEVINRYAPEHLILNLQNATDLTAGVRHAGSVFIGPWTPESAGDYASGTNHTLPTYGYARMYSGVSVDSFLKHITFQELDRNGLEALGPSVEKMAEVEQLEAHKRAVRVRLKHRS